MSNSSGINLGGNQFVDAESPRLNKGTKQVTYLKLDQIKCLIYLNQIPLWIQDLKRTA